MAALFGKKPEVQKPATMPDAESPAIIEAERQRRESIMARGGRQSTILGGDYSGDKLG